MSEDSNVALESESLRRLKELETTGKFVFHGSDHVIYKLEPRQAFNAGAPDGKPAVCASKTIDIALFCAIFKGHKTEGWSGWSAYSGDKFYADSEMYKAAETGKGYVHVMLLADFEEFAGRGEMRATHPITPIEVIEVNRQDFKPQVIVAERKDFINHTTS